MFQMTLDFFQVKKIINEGGKNAEMLHECYIL